MDTKKLPSSRDPLLQQVNVVISPLIPSQLPPIALRQYNCVTKRVQKSQRKIDAKAVAEDNEKKSIASSPLSCIIPSENQSIQSFQVLNCDQYFCNGAQPYSSPVSPYKESPTKDNNDLCTPDSPISIDNNVDNATVDCHSKYSAKYSKEIHAEATAEQILRDDEGLLKKCNVVLKPVSSSVKTVYLNGKQSGTVSRKAESELPAKDNHLPNKVTEKETDNSISESINFDNSNLESQIKESLSLKSGKSVCLKWIKSVNLGQRSPLVEKLMSTKSANSIPGNAEDCFSADATIALNLVSSDATIDLPLNQTCEPEEGSKSIPKRTCESEADTDSQPENQIFATSLEAKCIKVAGEKWIKSVNLEMSPLIPKPASLFVQKASQVQLDGKELEFDLVKECHPKVRRDILSNQEQSHETFQDLQNDTNDNCSQDSFECVLDTLDQSKKSCIRNEKRNSDLTSEKLDSNTHSRMEQIGCKKCLKSSEIEKSMKPVKISKQLLLTEPNYKESISMRTRTNSRILIGESSSANEESVKAFSPNTAKTNDGSRSSTLSGKNSKLNLSKKRKRTFSWSHRGSMIMPAKKRFRSFSSSLISTEKLNYNSQNMSFASELRPETTDDIVLIPTKWSLEVTQDDMNKNCPLDTTIALDQEDICVKEVSDDWLLCDRSVDSIPDEDEDELKQNSVAKAVNRSPAIVYQDHAYSICPKKSFSLSQYSIKVQINGNRIENVVKAKKQSSKIQVNKKKVKDRKLETLSNQVLQKKYKLSIPLKELVVYCERLVPDNLNILRVPAKLEKCKPVSTSKIRNKAMRQGTKRKTFEHSDEARPSKKQAKKTLPSHYRAFKPDQIKTIKHIKMRYRVAFHLWPQKYTSALDKINQRLTSQNMFWKNLDK